VSELAGAVRELVTKITFKTDTASLNRTKDAIENLKRSLQNLGGSLDSSLGNSLNNVRRNITRVSMSIRNLQRQMQNLNNFNGGGGNNSTSGLLNAIRNLRVNHADKVYIKGNIQGRGGSGGSGSGGGRGGDGGGGALGEVAAGIGLPVGMGKAAGILALGAGAASAVSTFMDFDATMSKVQALTGATGADMEKLTKTARELGATTQFSASQSAEAMTYLGMAGWGTSQIIGGMPGLLNLAAAGNVDLATTADIVSDGMTAMGYVAGQKIPNAYGVMVDSTTHFADIMAATSTNANTNVQMMGETFKYAAATAGALGYNLEDLGLATGLMANAGIKASMAGTALRSTMTRLVSPPKTAATALDALNFSATKSDGTLKSFREQIVELREKFKDLTDAEKAEYAQQIAGQEAMSGFLALMTASEQDFNKLTKAVDGSDGAAAKMAKTMQDNLSGSLKSPGSAAEESALKFGGLLEPAVRGVVDALTESITEGNNFFGTTDKLASFDFGNSNNLAEFEKRMQEYEKLAKENPIAAKFANLERSRRTAVQLHEAGQGNTTADLTKYEQMYSQAEEQDPQAVQILEVWNKLEEGGARIQAIFGDIEEIFSNLFSGATEGFENFAPLFGAATVIFESGLNDLSEAWNEIKEPVTESANLTGEVLVAAFGILSVIGGAAFKILAYVVKEVFAPALKFIIDVINRVLEKILSLRETGESAFKALSSAAETVSSAISGIIGTIKEVIDWFGNLINKSNEAADKSAANAGSVRNTSCTCNNSANINVSGYTPGATPQVVRDFYSTKQVRLREFWGKA